MKSISLALALLAAGTTACNAQSSYGQDNYGQSQDQGLIVSPGGGANGGICFGVACGTPDGSSQFHSDVGPQVKPHGGAAGGPCFGPSC